MSKSDKRQKLQDDKTARKNAQASAGGKSKYAKKRVQSARGNFRKTSPFYVSPREDAAARSVGANWIDDRGRPVTRDGDPIHPPPQMQLTPEGKKLLDSIDGAITAAAGRG